jgi:catechol 2,3-dioxygenase-like lactoylglutathione lyase family enzyme
VIKDVNRASFYATIPTSDLGASRHFYEDVLALEVAREHPTGVAFRTGQTYLEIYPSRTAGSAQHTLGTFEVEDIETTVQALRERGVVFEDYDLPGLQTVNGVAKVPSGVKVAWFKDPEGNILGIVQPTLRTRLSTFPDA